MATINNIKGTSYPSFSIGKKGATLYQGTASPTGGNDGDVYIQNGTTGNQAIWQRLNGTWTTLQISTANLNALSAMSPTNNTFLAFNGTTLVQQNASAHATALGLGNVAFLNTGTSVGNIPVLDATGKIPVSTLPPLAITDVFVVADIPARDALTVHEGDVALVQSNGLTYIYDGSAWQTIGSVGTVQAITTPSGTVTGVVTLDASYILTGTLSNARGGTGFSTYNVGDILVGNGSNGLTTLPHGSSNQVLQVSGSTVSWQSLLGSAVAFTPTTSSQLVSTNVQSAINETATTRPFIHAATSNPIITNDSSQNYKVGDLWINTTLNRLFIASNVSAAAAIWNELSLPVLPNNVRYVSTTGLDINDGSFNRPYLTIGNALSNISAGGTLVLLPGSFTESPTIATNNISIVTLGHGSTISGKLTVTGSGFNLFGVNVSNSSDTPVVLNGAVGAHLFYSTITPASATAVAVSITGANGVGNIIENCAINGIVQNTASTTSPVKLIGSYNFGVDSQAGATIVYNAENLSTVSHSTGTLTLHNVRSIASIISTATASSSNNINMIGINLQQVGGTYGTLTKSGTCGFILSDSNYDVTTSFTGTRSYTRFADDITGDYTPTSYTISNPSIKAHLAGLDTKIATLGTASHYNDLTDVSHYSVASANQVVQVNPSGTGLTFGFVLGTAAQNNTTDFATATQGSLATTAIQPAGLSAVGAATGGKFLNLTDAPNSYPINSVGAVVQINGTNNGLVFGPQLSAVAVSGSYNDLINLPTLGTASTFNVGTGSGNIVQLDTNGLIPVSTLPAIAITDVFVVADIPARDALVVHEGDVAKVTSTNQTFIYDGTQWIELSANNGGVTSVAGRTGDVTLAYTDISGLSTVAHTGVYSDLTGTPTLATVATSGSYTDLSNAPATPVIPAKDLYVDLNGNDSTGNGSFLYPYRTIGAAFTAATQGTVISVGAGTFTETLTLSNKLVFIKGNANVFNAATVISGTTTISGTSAIRFSDIGFQNTNSASTAYCLHVTNIGTVAGFRMENVWFDRSTANKNQTAILFDDSSGAWTGSMTMNEVYMQNGNLALNAASAYVSIRSLPQADNCSVIMTAGTMDISNSWTIRKVVHNGGLLQLINIHEITKDTANNNDCIVSTATNATGNGLFLINVSTIQDDTTQGRINKTGSCVYGLNSFTRNIANDVLTGTQLPLYGAYAQDFGAGYTATHYTGLNTGSIFSHLVGIDAALGSISGGVVTSVAGRTGAVTLAYTDISGLSTVAHSGAYSDLSGTPVLAAVATSGAYTDLTGTPTLATVATSGSYLDLTNKPVTPVAPAATHYVDLNGNDITGTGNFLYPFRTVNAAYTAAAAGDLIVIGAGNFAENLTISKSISIKGVFSAHNNFQTIIQGTTVLTGVSNIRISDIEFFNPGSAATAYAMHVTQSGSGPGIRMQNVCFERGSTNATQTAVLFDDTAGTWAASVTIDNMFVQNGNIVQSGASTYISIRSMPVSDNTTVTLVSGGMDLNNVSGLRKIVHTAGILALNNILQVQADTSNNNDSIVSTANNPAADVLIINNVGVVQNDGSLGRINKTGSCPYSLSLYSRNLASDVLTGTVIPTYRSYAQDINAGYQATNYTGGPVDSISAHLAGIDTKLATSSGSTTLAGLTDVSVSSPADGQVLTYVSSASKWENKTPVLTSVAGRTGAVVLAYTDISGLSTVAHTGVYSDLSGKPTIPTTLETLTDVTVTSVASGQVLSWNGTAWINSTPAAGDNIQTSGTGTGVFTAQVSGEVTMQSNSKQMGRFFANSGAAAGERLETFADNQTLTLSATNTAGSGTVNMVLSSALGQVQINANGAANMSSGAGQAISIKPGTSTTGTGANLTLTAGDTSNTSSNGGNLVLVPGAAGAGGTVGQVLLTTGYTPISNDSVVNKSYVSTNQSIYNTTIVSAAGTYSVALTDFVLLIKKTTPAANTVSLPSTGMSVGKVYKIKDSGAQAGANTITISGNGNTIDSLVSQQITTNYGFLTVLWNGTEWSIIS